MLLVVGVLIGGIIAFAGIKVADLAGLNDDTSSTGNSSQRLHVPRNGYTPSTGTRSSAPQTSTTPGGGAPSTTTSPPNKPHKPHFTLTISPTSASTYEHIDLTGTYDAPDGTALQVQRKENGSWVDFNATTSVSNHQFHTYIETGHTGVNIFRVADVFRGTSSQIATVTVH
jgi:LysM repeat protein